MKEFVKNNIKIIIPLAIAFLLVLGIAIPIIARNVNSKKNQDQIIELKEEAIFNSDEAVEQQSPSEEAIEIPNDNMPNFDILHEQNEDIYAWIEIPGTDVDYPVLQNEVDDYYLLTNLDLSSGYPGCLYSNKPDSKDFSDFVHIIYGHNMSDGSAFGSLKEFYSKEFFETHDTIFVYTAEAFLTYEIIEVRRHNDSYIPLEYDLNSTEGRTAFINMLNEGEDDISHVRSSAEFSEINNYLILSTCIGGEEDNRYLVIGMLVERRFR